MAQKPTGTIDLSSVLGALGLYLGSQAGNPLAARSQPPGGGEACPAWSGAWGDYGAGAAGSGGDTGAFLGQQSPGGWRPTPAPTVTGNAATGLRVLRLQVCCKEGQALASAECVGPSSSVWQATAERTASGLSVHVGVAADPSLHFSAKVLGTIAWSDTSQSPLESSAEPVVLSTSTTAKMYVPYTPPRRGESAPLLGDGPSASPLVILFVLVSQVKREVLCSLPRPPAVEPLWSNPVGLLNQGTTCYLNVLVQHMFHVPLIRALIFAADPFAAGERNAAGLVHLQETMETMQTQGNVGSTAALTAGFGWEASVMQHQQDVQELQRAVHEYLEQRCKGTALARVLPSLVRGEMVVSRTCKHVDYQRKNKECFEDLLVPITAKGTLLDSLRQLTAPQDITGYDTDSHGRQAAEEQTKISTLPPILGINLARVQYNPVTFSLEKNCGKLEFPDRLDMAPFYEPPTEDEQGVPTTDAEDAGDAEGGPAAECPFSQRVAAAASEARQAPGTVYRLHTVIVHAGDDGSSGHYFAYVRPNLGLLPAETAAPAESPEQGLPPCPSPPAFSLSAGTQSRADAALAGAPEHVLEACSMSDSFVAGSLLGDELSRGAGCGSEHGKQMAAALQWCLVDDKHTRPVSHEEATQNHYEGSTCAYMLMYVKESCAQTVLDPFQSMTASVEDCVQPAQAFLSDEGKTQLESAASSPLAQHLVLHDVPVQNLGQACIQPPAKLQEHRERMVQLERAEAEVRAKEARLITLWVSTSEAFKSGTRPPLDWSVPGAASSATTLAVSPSCDYSFLSGLQRGEHFIPVRVSLEEPLSFVYFKVAEALGVPWRALRLHWHQVSRSAGGDASMTPSGPAIPAPTLSPSPGDTSSGPAPRFWDAWQPWGEPATDAGSGPCQVPDMTPEQLASLHPVTGSLEAHDQSQSQQEGHLARGPVVGLDGQSFVSGVLLGEVLSEDIHQRLLMSDTAATLASDPATALHAARVGAEDWKVAAQALSQAGVGVAVHACAAESPSPDQPAPTAALPPVLASLPEQVVSEMTHTLRDLLGRHVLKPVQGALSGGETWQRVAAHAAASTGNVIALADEGLAHSSPFAICRPELHQAALGALPFPPAASHVYTLSQRAFPTARAAAQALSCVDSPATGLGSESGSWVEGLPLGGVHMGQRLPSPVSSPMRELAEALGLAVSEDAWAAVEAACASTCPAQPHCTFTRHAEMRAAPSAPAHFSDPVHELMHRPGVEPLHTWEHVSHETRLASAFLLNSHHSVTSTFPAVQFVASFGATTGTLLAAVHSALASLLQVPLTCTRLLAAGTNGSLVDLSTASADCTLSTLAQQGVQPAFFIHVGNHAPALPLLASLAAPVTHIELDPAWVKPLGPALDVPWTRAAARQPFRCTAQNKAAPFSGMPKLHIAVPAASTLQDIAGALAGLFRDAGVGWCSVDCFAFAPEWYTCLPNLPHPAGPVEAAWRTGGGRADFPPSAPLRLRYTAMQPWGECRRPTHLLPVIWGGLSATAAAPLLLSASLPACGAVRQLQESLAESPLVLNDQVLCGPQTGMQPIFAVPGQPPQVKRFLATLAPSDYVLKPSKQTAGQALLHVPVNGETTTEAVVAHVKRAMGMPTALPCLATGGALAATGPGQVLHATEQVLPSLVSQAGGRLPEGGVAGWLHRDAGVALPMRFRFVEHSLCVRQNTAALLQVVSAPMYLSTRSERVPCHPIPWAATVLQHVFMPRAVKLQLAVSAETPPAKTQPTMWGTAGMMFTLIASDLMTDLLSPTAQQQGGAKRPATSQVATAPDNKRSRGHGTSLAIGGHFSEDTA